MYLHGLDYRAATKLPNLSTKRLHLSTKLPNLSKEKLQDVWGSGGIGVHTRTTPEGVTVDLLRVRSVPLGGPEVI